MKMAFFFSFHWYHTILLWQVLVGWLSISPFFIDKPCSYWHLFGVLSMSWMIQTQMTCPFLPFPESLSARAVMWPSPVLWVARSFCENIYFSNKIDRVTVIWPLLPSLLSLTTNRDVMSGIGQAILINKKKAQRMTGVLSLMLSSCELIQVAAYLETACRTK